MIHLILDNFCYQCQWVHPVANMVTVQTLVLIPSWMNCMTKKALNYFQVWFILPHCSDAAIQPVFLSPGKPDLWASPSRESLVCVGRKSGSHFSSCLYFSLSGNCLREASAVLDWAEALRQDLPSWPTCAAFCLAAYPSPPLPCSFAPLAPPVFSGMTS